MKIRIDLDAGKDSCNLGNCPASFPVIGEPGGRVHIGKRLLALDPEAYEQIRGRIGDGEEAYWMPDGLE